jgi:NADPH-dependent curcumin reductase CurA
MSVNVSREIHLKNRPVGLPSENDFELAEVAVPDIGQGEMLVRNLYMSVDPYMRGRMYDRKSYVPPFELNQPLEGGCVGQVIESNNDRYKVGEYVSDMMGWREYYVSDGSGVMRIDQKIAPLQAFLGTVGMPGLTAYVGLLDIGRLKPGESVFVSAAAGAVGSVVGQIAKLKGCHVVGSAGSNEKVTWLKETAEMDAAFNYKEIDDLKAELGKHCPKGIDVYFENVGGQHLEAALEHMNPFGRVVMCGMISQYNATKPIPGPANIGNSISRRLTLQGFIVSDHMQRQKEFFSDMAQWIGQGRIKWKETIFEGIENAPKAFIGLFKGDNFGKMIVKL